MDTPDSTTLKRCTKCGEEKPREMYCRDKDKRDGLHSQCKTCQREYRQRNTDRKREQNRKYYLENTERCLNYQREYYQQNAERRREYNRKYNQENAERISDGKREYYRENVEQIRKYRQENADNLRDYARKYRQTPRGKASNTVTSNRRRARKQTLPDTFTATDWQFTLTHFNGCCAACGRQPGFWHTLAADHWIPLNSPDCPGTVAWNIVPLCHGNGGCNNQKKSRDAAEWLIEKFGKRKGRAILRRIEAFLDSRKPDAA